MISYKKHRGFSLVEAMMAMLVIGLVFVMVAPFVIKKVATEKDGKLSKGFYFQHAIGDNSRCYVTKTVTNNGLSDQIIIEQSNSCQEYTFVVPSNVHAVDLTLVAGGGGGGGASGGTVFENNLKYAEGKTVSDGVLVNLDTLKHVYIDYMIGKGQKGEKGASGKAGTGGYSGNAIVDYKMSRETVYDWLFKTPMEFFVKNNPEEGGDYNPVNKKLMTENYKRFYAKFGYVGTGGDTYLDFLRYGNLGDTKRCQDSNVDDTDSCMSAKLIAKNGNSGDIFNCVTRTGLEDEDSTKCYNDISDTSSLMARQAPINFSAAYKGSDTSAGAGEKMYNSQLQGTQGGSIVQAGTCGVGGKGGYVYTSPNDSGGSITKYSDGEPGTNGCGSIIVATEYAGQSGAGGVGGTAVTFKNFPVIPGSAYKIYVGKGGAGGASGISGFLSNNKNTEIAGNKGVGGASAAIYDEDDNLIVMVLGGVGGAGGNIKTVKKELLTNSPNPNDILPNQINSTRQYPVIIVGREYIADGNDLSKLGSIEENVSNNNITIYQDTLTSQLNENFGRAFRVEYKYANTKTAKNAEGDNIEQLIQSKEAVRLLNLNNQKIYTRNAAVINFDNTADNDKRTGGFSNYARLKTGDDNFDNNLYSSGIKVKNTTYDNIYNGFYVRYLDGVDYMYAGGLGGFSGLGTKAGCGGGFVGNKEGMTKNSGYNSIFENTFIIGRSNTNETNKLNAFNVNEYYDGCSLKTPDGQSAEFIKPSVSSIDGEIVGQAGSGGGGGGWSTKYGAGKGGDGQDGYVFMTWKK